MKGKSITITTLSIACAGLLLASLTPSTAYPLDLVGVYVDETEIRLPIDTGNAARSDVGDVDGDGDLDIIVPGGAYTGFPVPLQDFLMQINNGSGVFTNEAGSRLPSTAFQTQYAAAAVFGDVDGDGDLDVFVANGTSLISPNTPDDWQNRLWINDGSGRFSDETSTRLPSVSDSSFHVAFGDIDGDGDLDIVVGNVGPYGMGQQNNVLINNGTGGFTDETATRLPANADITLTVVLEDLDADSDLDLLVANGSTWNASKVLINDGNGVFSDETVARLEPAAPFGDDIRVSDLDGDGDKDILFSSLLGGPLLYINDGNNFFVDETSLRTPVYSGTLGLALTDVDRDGDLDVFVALDSDRQSILLLNDGQGFFVNASATNLPAVLVEGMRYPVCGDVDNDGDPDLYLAVTFNYQTNEQDRLLINLGSPFSLIEDLINETVVLDLKRGVERSLVNKLDGALSRLTNEKPSDDATALRLLNNYVTIVNKKSGTQILPEDAAMLIDLANEIIDRLSHTAKCL